MDKPDINNIKGELEKTLPFCYSISGLANVYTIFIYRKRTPFDEKRPYYWLGYGLRKLCGTTIPFVMRVCDYIPLMSPVNRGNLCAFYTIVIQSAYIIPIINLRI